MNQEEIKEYLKKVDELEFKLVDEDKDTLQWLIFGYNECARLLNEKEKENQRLKEIEKEHQRINGELRIEIKELKEKYMKLEDKYIHNVSCCNEEDCDLFSEHQELKKQLEVGEEQYNDLVEEKEKLQEQLSINTLQLEEMKLSKRDYTQENILTMKLTLKENQQKEFIEYLDNMLDNENDIFSVVRVKDVLSKYKEIIGDKE